MDREYDFDKFLVKVEVADLFLQPWSHPNRECRMSVVKSVEPPDFLAFATSLSSALSVFFDGAVQQLSTTLKTIKSGRSRLDLGFIDAHLSAAAGSLLAARRLMLLLCTLSKEETPRSHPLSRHYVSWVCCCQQLPALVFVPLLETLSESWIPIAILRTCFLFVLVFRIL